MTYEQDVETMKQQMLKEKEDCFAMLNILNKANKQALSDCGYTNKTNAEAMQISFNHSQKKIDRIINEFLKKYPD